MTPPIYLDHAATAWPVLYNASVADALGNPSSAHPQGKRAKASLDSSRRACLQALRAHPGGTVLFTSGGTEADNIVLFSGQWDFIITARTEHHAVYHTAQSIASGQKTDLVFIRVTATGLIQPTDLQALLREPRFSGRRGLVSLMMVNNEIGTLQDIASLARLSHTVHPNCWFHTNAVQAPGHVPLDVTAMDVDFASISAHKFHGPCGVGLLYCRDVSQLRVPIMIGGEQEGGMRPGTQPVASIAAMTRALTQAQSYSSDHWDTLKVMRDRLGDVLLPYIVCGSVLPTGHPEQRAPHILSFCVKGIKRGELQKHIAEKYGVMLSGGSACNTHNPLPSHVLSELGIPADFIDGNVRLAVSHTNTQNEIERAREALCMTLAALLPDGLSCKSAVGTGS